MQEHGSERTAGNALIAGNTFFLIHVNDTVCLENGIGRTVFTALWHPALPANDWHPDNRLWIKDHHPHPALFGVIDPGASDAASKFTYLAA
jgi:hypothetical protein